jgi:threonyl-tRNA synthetase
MPSLHTDSQLTFIRHSAAELLACAVQELFPGVLLVGGHVTDVGFFYDFVFEQPLYPEALTLIEVRMRALIKEEKEIRSLSMMRENASQFFLHHEQPLLSEKAAAEESNIVSLFQLDQFFSLSEGPHLQNTGELGVVKLLEQQEIVRSFSFCEEKIEVTRLIGTAFSNAMELKRFLKAYDYWAKKRDHRQLGPELNLFSLDPKAGDLGCFWHPKGEKLKQLVQKEWQNRLNEDSFLPVSSPALIKKDFVEKKKELLPSLKIEEEEYVLASSHFSHHLSLFNKLNVENERLPLRLVECYTAYTQEEEFRLSGLLRSRSYATDLLTTFCLREQVKEELISSLQFIEKTFRIYSFEAHWYLTVAGQKASKVSQLRQGSLWLEEALKSCHIDYATEVSSQGSGFIPRLELRLVDCLGREWRMPSIEVIEFNDPSRPVVIKTSLFDSVDRFIALLIEQSEGVFPWWLAPEQIRVLSIGNQNKAYAEAICKACKERGYRVQSDVRGEKLSVKIHAAEKEKVPCILIVGDKEENKKLISVRLLNQRNKGLCLSLDELFQQIEKGL